MKKVLFASALLALAAGCAENELDSLSIPEQGKGISFVVEQAPSTRMQWDETETAYVPFWYAEQDRIGIFAVNVKKGAFGSETDLTARMLNSWTGLPSAASVADVTYKATQSKQTGAFTAIQDDNLLHFNDNKNARFLAVYPSSIKAMFGGATESKKIILSDLPKISEQTQTTTKGYNEAVTMYSLSIASKENPYDAVGEKVNLSFKRPLSALVMKTANANEYTKLDDNNESTFGKLTKVTVTAKGWTVPAGGSGTPIAASKLAYDETKATIEVDTVAGYKAEFKEGTSASEADAITLNIGKAAAGLDWNDDALAIAAIKNVDRSKTFSSTKKETVEVKFSFEKIDLVKTMETGNSWNNKFIEVPAIDIEKYPYLVTKGTTGSGRTLIVNSETFSKIFKEDGTIKWTDEYATTGSVALANIETIISNVALTDAEMVKLNTFGKLKNLTLAENTSIPANTFTTTQARQMVKLDLPKVTTVSKKFVNNSEDVVKFVELQTLKMPAYSFEDEKINESLLNPGTTGNTKLKVLDMSGVTSMMPIYGILRTMTFTNYTELTEVTVKDGVVVAPKGFKGCKALKTVTGKLDISKASEAFAMGTVDDGGNNSTLTTIEINGTVIPEGAFTNCTKLATVKYNGNIVAPTAIGSNAFAATEVQYMDLSNAKTIGEAAFKGCAKLAKTNENAQDLVVGTEKIAADVFNGCTSLVIVKFTNATEIVGGDVFVGATGLKQVKFEKVFKLADDAEGTNDLYKDVFTADPSGIDFWVNAAQPNVSGSKLTLSYKKGTGSSATTENVEYEFKSIQ